MTRGESRTNDSTEPHCKTTATETIDDLPPAGSATLPEIRGEHP